MLQGNIVNLSASSRKGLSIAFDFDGTLVDCKIRQVEVLRSVIRRREFIPIDIDLDEWWNLKRDGLNTNDALIKIGVNPTIAKAITAYWIESIEDPQWLDLDGLKTDVLPFLRFLNKNGNRLYLITARKSKFYCLHQLQKLALTNYFDDIFIVDSSNAEKKKIEALKSIKPDYFFGDSESDYYAAISAVTNFIGLSSGQRSRKFLTKIEATIIYHNLWESVSPFQNKRSESSS